MRILSNGIGVGVGDVLLTNEPLHISGNVWFVDNGDTNANDAASPQGLSPEYPLESLFQAITNATTGDIIVLRSTHDEEWGNTLVLTSKALTIVGEGRTGGAPSARLKCDSGAGELLTLGTVRTQLRNIRFGPGSVAAAYESVVVGSGADGSQIIGCQFEAGDNDTAAYAVKLASSGVILEDCVFKSVGTDPTAAPVGLLATTGALEGIIMKRCSFDNGVSGFSGASGYGYAADLSDSALSDLYIESLSLLRGADMKLHSGTSRSIVHVATCTGASKVVW